MQINMDRCEELLNNNEIFSAHLILKIIRGDFVIGKDGIDDWIKLLKNDDLYLIYRFFADYKDNDTLKIPNKQDIFDVCSMLFYIQNGKDGDNNDIELLIIELTNNIIKETKIRGLENRITE